MRHIERHKTHRIGWLRAAVLGANDGIASTASLVQGVAASGATVKNTLIAAVAGLVAGAMSMAAGEYVSVSSQADSERADLARERRELANDPKHEHAELTNIYVERGLDEERASQVATQLMERDALGAHARDLLRCVGDGNYCGRWSVVRGKRITVPDRRRLHLRQAERVEDATIRVEETPAAKISGISTVIRLKRRSRRQRKRDDRSPISHGQAAF
ncbi:MAG: VIT1/CCC1 transporter family protein [Acidobacteriota bacterium]